MIIQYFVLLKGVLSKRLAWLVQSILKTRKQYGYERFSDCKSSFRLQYSIFYSQQCHVLSLFSLSCMTMTRPSQGPDCAAVTRAQSLNAPGWRRLRRNLAILTRPFTGDKEIVMMAVNIISDILQPRLPLLSRLQRTVSVLLGGVYLRQARHSQGVQEGRQGYG